jgi:hypothetical protein
MLRLSVERRGQGEREEKGQEKEKRKKEREGKKEEKEEITFFLSLSTGITSRALPCSVRLFLFLIQGSW